MKKGEVRPDLPVVQVKGQSQRRLQILLFVQCLAHKPNQLRAPVGELLSQFPQQDLLFQHQLEKEGLVRALWLLCLRVHLAVRLLLKVLVEAHPNRQLRLQVVELKVKTLS